MIYENIIIGIGIIISLFLFKKTQPKLLIGLLIALIISFILSFFDMQILRIISLCSFGILSLIFVVYSGIKRKWLNFIIGFFAFISFYSKLMYLPFANELKLLMLAPIIIYVLTFIKKGKNKNELSVLTIFVAYQLSEFIDLIVLWLN